MSVGVLWDDAGHPLEGSTQSAMDYYPGILRLLDLITDHLPSILLEVECSLSQILRLAQKSSWKS